MRIGPGHVHVHHDELVAALAGMDIVRLPDYMCAEDLSSGAFEEVLNDWPEPPVECHAIYPATRHLPLRVRSFLDFVVESMSEDRQE